MARPATQIDVTRQGDICCVRLRKQNLSEEELNVLTVELFALVEKGGCRKMVLNLGPHDPILLYSIFLAKLVSLQRRLAKAGGHLKLAHVGEQTLDIFRACNLHELFDFYPDDAAAIAAMPK